MRASAVVSPSAAAAGPPAITRFTAVLVDRRQEAAFRESTRHTERVALRVAAVVVAMVDVIAQVANALAGIEVTTRGYLAVQAAGLAVCGAVWVLLGRARLAHWRLRTTGSALALIAVITALVWSGYDMSFRGALLIPTGVLVIYLAVRLDLLTLTAFAGIYAAATFTAWVHVSPHAAQHHLSFLVTLTGLALVVGLLECRRLQQERRRVFCHQAALRRISTTDNLTGLANRRLFYEVAAEHLARPGGGRGPLAILLIDLDRFKEINDTLGHHTGDVLLREVAGRLRRSLPDALMLARLGGDEFAALVAGEPGDGEEWAVGHARRFLSGLGPAVELDGLSVHVRASVGVAVRDAGQDRAGLLRQADVAMDEAKRAGGGIRAYTPEHDAYRRETVELASRLDAALDTDEIELFYQPKTDIATGETNAVEALIRWHHPLLGLLTPDRFLDTAKQHGMMRRLTLRVITLALAQSKAWREAGRPVRIAVNLAPANLLDARFPDDVGAVLAGSGLTADALRLEITEDTLIVDPDRILATLNRLAAMGFTFALDDYGTGYSSLAYLSVLPIDELKIDRSFVTDFVTNRHNEVIVRSTIQMARELGFHVVAEGIEDAATWRRLASLNCHTGQGYFLSRPVPARELDRWLSQRRASQAAPIPAAPPVPDLPPRGVAVGPLPGGR